MEEKGCLMEILKSWEIPEVMSGLLLKKNRTSLEMISLAMEKNMKP